jgi:hypothetical protein
MIFIMAEKEMLSGIMKKPDINYSFVKRRGVIE